VVDDCSTDATSKFLDQLNGLRKVRLRRNVGYVKANNLGARLAKGKYLVLLNDDTLVTVGWLESLLETLKRDQNAGAVGSKLIYPTGKLQEAGSIVWNDGHINNYGTLDDAQKPEYLFVRSVDYCSGASLALRRELIRSSGVYDTRFSPGYYEDVDLCLYVRSMKKNVIYQPNSAVIHYKRVSGSPTQALHTRIEANHKKFVNKWRDYLGTKYSSSARNILRARSWKSERSLLVLCESDEPVGARAVAIADAANSLDLSVTLIVTSKSEFDVSKQNCLRQKGVELMNGDVDVASILSQRRSFYDTVVLVDAVSLRHLDPITRWNPLSLMILYVTSHTINQGHLLNFVELIDLLIADNLDTYRRLKRALPTNVELLRDLQSLTPARLSRLLSAPPVNSKARVERVVYTSDEKRTHKRLALGRENYAKLSIATHSVLSISRKSVGLLRSEGIRSLIRQTGKKIAKREFRIIEPDLIQFDQYFPQHVKASTSTPPDFGVNLMGYFTGRFGLAASARAFAEALEQASVPLVLNKQVSGAHGERYVFPMKSFSYRNPYAINITHTNPIDSKYFFLEAGPAYSHGRYNVGIWYWELQNFPTKWQDRFQYYDELWAVSQFTAASLSKISPIPVVKVRYPLSAPEDAPLSPEAKTRSGFKDQFIFLFVFDFHSFFERKNPHGLLRAFSDAFCGRKDVQLVLNCINGNAYPRELRLLRNMSRSLNVRLLEGHLTPTNYYTLFAAADCYVSLHRSEGFGIPMAEAMFLGKPVIATGYSGNMDYMNVNNSFLVKFKMTELDKTYGPYEKGNVWADPDIEHAVEQMRWVCENKDKAKQIGKRAQLEVKQTLNPILAGREMRERLELINAKMTRSSKP